MEKLVDHVLTAETRTARWDGAIFAAGSLALTLALAGTLLTQL